MIPRRIAEHVKAHNWFAVGIDFLIVVVGVFVGLQVNNWNARLADERAAAAYLADIAADIRADQTEISRVVNSAKARISAATYIMRRTGQTDIVLSATLSRTNALDVFSGSEQYEIPDLAPPAEAERDFLWPIATGIYAYDKNRSAYDALIGSGRIELIDDPAIGKALREYYYLVNAFDETQRRTLVPIRNHIMETGIARGLSPESRLAEALFIDKVAADPALAAAVATSREHAAMILMFCRLIEDKGRALLALLDEREAAR